jgi:hypothetical protein
MRLLPILLVVTFEALSSFLFPQTNRRSRLPFEEPKRSGRDDDASGRGVPVLPYQPLGLSGGAAASMQFDE